VRLGRIDVSAGAPSYVGLPRATAIACIVQRLAHGVLASVDHRSTDCSLLDVFIFLMQHGSTPTEAVSAIGLMFGSVAGAA
jgi:hypothetical protein